MSARITSAAEFADLRVAPPTPTGESAPFWESVRAGVLSVQRCRSCGVAQGHPRRRCAACWSADLGWHEASGRAEIVTHTLVHYPGQELWMPVAPYYVALVRLEEDSGEGAVLLTHLLTGSATPHAGDPCVFEPTRVGDWVLPFFRLSTPTGFNRHPVS